MTLAQKTAAAISSVALFGAVAHLAWPHLAIDAITLTLVGIAVIPWLAPLFKAVELPGGVKVEFAELEKAERKAVSSGLIESDAPPAALKTAEPELVTSDPNLALASLRIEIERRLHRIAQRNGVPERRISVGGLVRELSRRELLNSQQLATLNDLLPSLNAAVHGAQVDPRATEWAAKVGPQILAALDLPSSSDVTRLLSQWSVADGAAVAEVGEQLSKTAVAAPGDFLRAMTANPATLESWLRDLQHHSFTVFRARDKVEDDLFSAYHERLRTRMLDALTPFIPDPVVGSTAKRVVDAVRAVALRVIV